VIISAGSGGTGFTGIQMAKAYGCFVITACGTDHVEFCKGLGADVVVVPVLVCLLLLPYFWI